MKQSLFRNCLGERFPSTALSPTFTTPTDLPATTVLEFTLRVTDEGGLSDEDTVRFRQSTVKPNAHHIRSI